MSRLIDADALMKEFADFVRASNNSDFEPVPTWNDAVSLVGSIPSAQPERKKGKWISHDCNGYKSIDCDMCSECGERFYQIAETGCAWKYCPNCGSYNGGD